MLKESQIEEFRALYKTRFGKEISKEEACERGTKLINLLKAIKQPITN